MSPYNYVLNNPLNSLDPNGLDVRFHSSAINNSDFGKVLELYMQTELGSVQMQRFIDDQKILVVIVSGPRY